MAFTPPQAPLVFLTFLATGFLVVVAGVTMAVLLLVRKPKGVSVVSLSPEPIFSWPCPAASGWGRA
ncbi:MAG: hypothetical protein ACE5H2_10275, partial [Terriglobia bacterium]